MLGFVCVALLVQGVGLQLPRVLRTLTAVSGATLVSSPSSVESQAASPGATTSCRFADRESVYRVELD